MLISEYVIGLSTRAEKRPTLLQLLLKRRLWGTCQDLKGTRHWLASGCICDLLDGTVLFLCTSITEKKYLIKGGGKTEREKFVREMQRPRTVTLQC